jgi:hypothetical protein
MSYHQPDISGGHLPIHAFYVPPQPSSYIIATTTTKSSSSSSSKQKLIFATPTATKSFKMIQTAAIIPTHFQHIKSNNRIASVSSLVSSPIISKLPPFINSPPPPHDNSFDNNKSTSPSDNNNNVSWLAPLFGVLGTMGVIITAVIFFVRRRRYKLASKALVHDDNSSCRNQPHKPITTNKYTSWASLSTINTSAPNMLEEEKKSAHLLQPPPAYSSTTTVRQKRLTADTLVNEPSLSMLKLQYSPQLAFSPSLVAGEFQQQLNHPPLPTANNNQQISPSNTLIDNAGVLSNEKNGNHYSFNAQQHQQRIKIEMYDPQVNLYNVDYDDVGLDELETPFSYPNNQEEKVNAFEGDKHDNEDTTAVSHQVVNMNNTNKQ